MTTLTEVEREALWDAIDGAFLDTTAFSHEAEDGIDAAVEAILTARLAKVEALADRWADDPGIEGYINLGEAVDALRAALSGDPGPEGSAG